MTNGNQKGKAGERELSKELNSLLGTECRRGQQYNGVDGHDVVGIEGVHVECKRVERLNVGDAIEQAERDADEGEIPSVFHRKNRKPWLVTIRLCDLIKFCRVILGVVK
ncbi:hypothetical protein KOR42_05750 [Thalassoglobus neptunius]|uniref:Restriction endonuclease type IV Mrr domain-containing protein n=1 Tax=Thalassoglobus neptunius TaxID=1938619 RepID=A0A5C5X2G3_9PLAN|nr:hypothetical protein [Thalassoglobus neptunius]TWT57217.1 hypothetical protein KOR42_05750 [Thalassoglobus neptunius]